MEEAFRNGVFLAKLARFYKPEAVKKIFDENRVFFSFLFFVFFFVYLFI